MSEVKKINNGRISLVIPEGFNELTAEECLELSGKNDAGNNYGIRNSDSHLLYNIAWKKIPFLGKLASLDKVIETTEKNFDKSIASFEKVCDCSATIGGKKVNGFRYRYITKKIEHIGEYLLMKHDGQFIAFICMAREETFDENYPIFQKFLESIEL